VCASVGVKVWCAVANQVGKQGTEGVGAVVGRTQEAEFARVY